MTCVMLKLNIFSWELVVYIIMCISQLTQLCEKYIFLLIILFRNADPDK